MKKLISCALIVFQLFILFTPIAAQPSDYELNYHKFVDSEKSLDELSKTDMATWDKPTLAKTPNSNRIDYFDVAYGSDPAQKLDIHHAKDGAKLKPVVIYIHGGGWVMGDKDDSKHAAPPLIKLGYTLVSINYRLGNVQATSPENRNAHPAQIEDCAMALKWVIDNIDKYGGDPNNIAITGISAGGHLTALLATGTKWQKKYNIDMSKVKCWIPMSGIYDFDLAENYYHPWMPGFFQGLLDAPFKKDDTSPVKNVTGKEPPCLILAGGDDWLVPKTNSTSLYNKLIEKGSKDVKLEIVKYYGHGNIVAGYGEFSHKPSKLMNKFLAKYLPSEFNYLKQ